MKVVDGLQRLSTVHAFARQREFVLRNLEYLSGEEGKGFDQLPALWQRRFHQTQLIAHVIDPQTPSQAKYDIFKRINTGGTPLNTQEIRHALSGQRSRDFLRRCAESPEFIRAVGERFRDHIRMADREMVLRFCAFRMLGPEEYQRAMDPFLDSANSRLDDPKQITNDQLDRLDYQYIDSITTSTGDPRKVRYRFAKAREILGLS
jgi:hypothetical protein